MLLLLRLVEPDLLIHEWGLLIALMRKIKELEDIGYILVRFVFLKPIKNLKSSIHGSPRLHNALLSQCLCVYIAPNS
jgi:hypothetical protein